MKTGGSNYITINASMRNPVIGTYHLYPDKVAEDFREMYEHGQRKLAFVLWFCPANFPAARDNLWYHCVNSYGGVMAAQHLENLSNILALINAIGFSEIVFRFGPQGKAMDMTWDAWDINQFNENWNFIKSVRDHVVANKGNLNVIFDLGGEAANLRLRESPVHNQYVRLLWRRYTNLYGTEDSCAFSIIHEGTGIDLMLSAFRMVGLPKPCRYYIDSYGHEYNALTRAKAVLDRWHEESKPIYILETFYNDATSYADIRRAVAETGINFGGIIQWPEARDQDAPLDEPKSHFDNIPVEQITEEPSSPIGGFCKRYDNYLVET